MVFRALKKGILAGLASLVLFSGCTDFPNIGEGELKSSYNGIVQNKVRRHFKDGKDTEVSVNGFIFKHRGKEYYSTTEHQLSTTSLRKNGEWDANSLYRLWKFENAEIIPSKSHFNPNQARLVKKSPLIGGKDFILYELSNSQKEEYSNKPLELSLTPLTEGQRVYWIASPEGEFSFSKNGTPAYKNGRVIKTPPSLISNSSFNERAFIKEEPGKEVYYGESGTPVFVSDNNHSKVVGIMLGKSDKDIPAYILPARELINAIDFSK